MNSNFLPPKEKKPKITDIETVTGLDSTTIEKKPWFR